MLERRKQSSSEDLNPMLTDVKASVAWIDQILANNSDASLHNAAHNYARNQEGLATDAEASKRATDILGEYFAAIQKRIQQRLAADPSLVEFNLIRDQLRGAPGTSSFELDSRVNAFEEWKRVEQRRASIMPPEPKRVLGPKKGFPKDLFEAANASRQRRDHLLPDDERPPSIVPEAKNE